MTPDERLVEQMRGKGWAHCLDLIAEGMWADAEKCGREKWEQTAGTLDTLGTRASNLAGDVRRAIASAEDRDRIILGDEVGCEC